tara:strand:- start:62 stop:571 length:510 start_codon:yes stop_codon:yes gene_type:complete
MSTQEPVVKVNQLLQICVLVNDLQKAMERYWTLFGIGPWRIYTHAPPHLTKTTLRGSEQTFSMKVAMAQVGPVEWELVQPLEGESIYTEFLAQRGEGLHHVGVAVDDFDEAVSALAGEGIGIQMGGRTRAGNGFAYMDTEKDIGAIVELFKRPEGWQRPPPEAVWPPQA